MNLIDKIKDKLFNHQATFNKNNCPLCNEMTKIDLPRYSKSGRKDFIITSLQEMTNDNDDLWVLLCIDDMTKLKDGTQVTKDRIASICMLPEYPFYQEYRLIHFYDNNFEIFPKIKDDICPLCGNDLNKLYYNMDHDWHHTDKFS